MDSNRDSDIGIQFPWKLEQRKGKREELSCIIIPPRFVNTPKWFHFPTVHFDRPIEIRLVHNSKAAKKGNENSKTLCTCHTINSN